MSHRRAHTKSRLGCSACKRRHIKCNEERPICRHCAANDRECIYEQPAKRATPSAATSSPQNASKSSESPHVARTDQATGLPTPDASTPSAPFASAFPGNSTTSASPQYVFLDGPVNMRHMELISHFITTTGPSLAAARPWDPEYARIVLSEALREPCLMHEILALSAFHLSQLRTEQAQAKLYREEAMTLQTQALSLFNATATNITEQNCSAILMFSSFLGLHALADAASTIESSAQGFLDRFVNYLNLHRGVRVITNQAWTMLKNSNVGGMLSHTEAQLSAASKQLEAGVTPATAHLQHLLTFDNMSTPHQTACEEAVQKLLLIYQLDSPPKHDDASGALIWTWPVTVSGVFTDLLMQRRPEALIILCHYAVLLHRRREMWFVGGSGQALVEGVTGFLGGYWADWLRWPNEVLREET